MDNNHKDNFSHYNGNLQRLSRTLRNNMTKSEACMWKYVLRARLMKGFSFRRQRPIDKYIVDFLCRELHLIIEVDGLTHDTEAAEQRDEQRDKHLQELGFTILRFTSNEVLQHIDEVRGAIEQWIEDNLSNSE
jgi:very-short-patch-repair endonuclease